MTFARDRFPLLLEDLIGFEGPRPILVEGAGLLPELIKPHLISPLCNVAFRRAMSEGARFEKAKIS